MSVLAGGCSMPYIRDNTGVIALSAMSGTIDYHAVSHLIRHYQRQRHFVIFTMPRQYYDIRQMSAITHTADIGAGVNERLIRQILLITATYAILSLGDTRVTPHWHIAAIIDVGCQLLAIQLLADG